MPRNSHEVPTGMRSKIDEIAARVETYTWTDEEIIAHSVHMRTMMEEQRLARLEELTDDDGPVYLTE